MHKYDFDHEARFQIVESMFDQEALRRICEMPEDEFARAYDMDVVKVKQKAPFDHYYFRDNGSEILAVAHLDTVAMAHERGCTFVDTEAGTVVFSRALDDRLGAYIILDLLPSLGITCDILLTTGEENGMSTADFFEPSKEYLWMIEFDRGGTDVVMYQFDDGETAALVKKSGARVGEGIFSDICYLEHLEVKGFNWGVGYRDYHSDRSHAFLDDTISMVARFIKFHEANKETYLPHDRRAPSLGRSVSWGWLDDDDDWGDDEKDDPTDEYVERDLIDEYAEKGFIENPTPAEHAAFEDLLTRRLSDYNGLTVLS